MNQELLADLSVVQSIGEICQQSIISCSEHESIANVLQRMSISHIGSIVVQKEGRSVAVVTAQQVLEYRLEHSGDDPVGKCIIGDMLFLPSTMLPDEATFELLKHQAKHALVIGENDQVIGLVSETDIVNHQGLAHDLRLKSVQSIATGRPIELSPNDKLSTVVAEFRRTGRDAAIVIKDGVSCIITRTDLVRLIGSDTPLNTLLDAIDLPELIAVDETLSLHEARRILATKGFRHLGLRGQDGQVHRIIAYSDIIRSVEFGYVQKLQDLLHSQNQRLEASQTSLQLIERIIESSLEGVLITDAQGNICSVNPAFTSITGYKRDEVVGKNPRLLSSGRHDSAFYQEMWQRLNKQGHWHGEIWNKTKDGRVYPEYLSITTIRDEEDNILQYAAIFHDLTDRMRSEARISEMANYDRITRLANRQLFNDRLTMALNFSKEHSRQFAVMVLNIDVFKRINARFGHHSGDKVLKELGERLSTFIGHEDTAARVDGDEFTLILNDMDRNTVVSRLDHLRRLVSMPILLEGVEIRLTTSAGVAFYPENGCTESELINAAEAALRHTKEAGRNNFSFASAELNEEHQSRYRIANLLHEAIRRGEFFLTYQPKAQLATGQIASVEALIRWQSAEMGLVPPDQFIALAESTGLIHEIGSWVIEEAVRQASEWHAQGVNITVAINVSAMQFQSGNLVNEISQALIKYQAQPEWICVELTESSFIQSAQETAVILQQLRDKGVHISIDDFGTGYSSLNYVRDMPLDELKIDRSFIMTMTESERDCQLVQAILAMSKALGLSVVAEGVETQEQLDRLRQMGCDIVQGYFLSKPIVASELTKWLESYSLPSSDAKPV